MKEGDINFFRPLWRRVAVTAVCVIWAGVEFLHGDQLWITITLALTAYAVWNFFIAFDKNPPPQVPAQASPPEATPPPEAPKPEASDVPPQA